MCLPAKGPLHFDNILALLYHFVYLFLLSRMIAMQTMACMLQIQTVKGIEIVELRQHTKHFAMETHSFTEHYEIAAARISLYR